MNIELGFGKKKIYADIPDKNLLAVLKPNSIQAGVVNEDEIREAIREPIASKRLKNIVHKDEKICIITSDITRPMPTKAVLPALLEELYEAGVKDENIIIVFALGNHRLHTEEEKKYIVGEDVYYRIKCIDSDQNSTVYLGKTSYGTPVELFEEVVKADRIICLGNIEYHYFAGYSGGAKAVMPGVSTMKAIQANHSRMVESTSAAGIIEGNNVRMDIEEVARFIKIDFIINVVLNENKQIVKVVAGDYIKAHRKGCKFLDELYKVGIKRRADIVIVSPGGFPKDINLYQAQKALDNAKNAVKDGGTIILVASCEEGLGEEVFERWINEAKNPQDMIHRIKRKFELGGHKAAAIAMVQQRADVYLVSSMNDDIVHSLYMKPFRNLEDAVNEALKKHGEDASVVVMPYGGSTLPVEC